jgi:hypothetical protein
MMLSRIGVPLAATAALILIDVPAAAVAKLTTPAPRLPAHGTRVLRWGFRDGLTRVRVGPWGEVR